MATTVDLGKVRPVWKGTWSGSTAYEVHDMVKEGVNSYICTTGHTSSGTFSNDSANWDDLAQGAELPLQTGNSGKVLKTDGSTLSWGDGLPTGGSADQVLKTDGSSNYSWTTVNTNLGHKAWFTYLDSANLRDIFTAAGIGSGEGITMPFNNVLDPYNIIGTVSGNSFQVNITGYYEVDAAHSGHTNSHYHPPYIWNNSDGKYAPRPDATFTGTGHENWMSGFPSYASSQDPRSPVTTEPVFLETGKNYFFFVDTEGSGGLGSGTSYLNGGRTQGGIQKYNAPFKASITLLAEV